MDVIIRKKPIFCMANCPCNLPTHNKKPLMLLAHLQSAISHDLSHRVWLPLYIKYHSVLYLTSSPSIISSPPLLSLLLLLLSSPLIKLHHPHH